MTARGLSPRTVRYTHSILRSAVAQAVRWRMLPGNPADLVELPKMVRKEMRALTPQEATNFLDAVRGDRWEALWELLLVTGLRPGEALGLQWSDVDWDQQRIRIQRTLVRDENNEWHLDEPTTALDVTIQTQILELLADVQKRRGMAVLLITHDLGVVAEVCDRVAVMYAGQIVETGSVQQIYSDPQHPYIRGLLESIPSLDRVGHRLKAIRAPCRTRCLGRTGAASPNAAR